MKENDVLLYLDMGCHLNWRGKEQLLSYWQEVKTNKSGFLVSELDARKIERSWTKGDVFDYFNVRNNLQITDTPQYQAGVLFIRKNKQTVDIITKWMNLFYTNFHLADDSASVSNNMDNFLCHRHDQSILSILLKLHGTSLIPIHEVYAEKEDRWNKKYPIMIKRDLR